MVGVLLKKDHDIAIDKLSAGKSVLLPMSMQTG